MDKKPILFRGIGILGAGKGFAGSVVVAIKGLDVIAGDLVGVDSAGIGDWAERGKDVICGGADLGG